MFHEYNVISIEDYVKDIPRLESVANREHEYSTEPTVRPSGSYLTRRRLTLYDGFHNTNLPEELVTRMPVGSRMIGFNGAVWETLQMISETMIFNLSRVQVREPDFGRCDLVRVPNFVLPKSVTSYARRLEFDQSESTTVYFWCEPERFRIMECADGTTRLINKFYGIADECSLFYS